MSILAFEVGRCLLRYHLKKKNMTQAKLAERLGVSEQQMNKYVNDRQRMSINVSKNISAIFGCRIKDLYEWIEVSS